MSKMCLTVYQSKYIYALYQIHIQVAIGIAEYPIRFKNGFLYYMNAHISSSAYIFYLHMFGCSHELEMLQDGPWVDLHGTKFFSDPRLLL